MLRVENLDVFHGDAQALDDVSLEIGEGAIVAIVGANGAGKTSLIRTIAGMHRPARGRIAFRGTDIGGWESHRVCNLGIGQVAEGRQVFPTLSVAENLEMGAMLPRARAEHGEESRARAGAVSRARRTLGPGGRHALGRRAADAGDRPLPDGSAGARHVRRAVAGPGAHDRAEVLRTIRDLNREGLTCVLVEQNVAVSLKLAAHAYVLENGRITLSGAGEELLADDRVRQAYLGM